VNWKSQTFWHAQEMEWQKRIMKRKLCLWSHHAKNVATLALGSWPRQGLARVRTKRECKRMWGNEPSHSQMSSHLGSWSPDGLPNLQRTIVGVKTHFIETFLISLKSFWTLMSEMALHDSFGHFKHKLWPKERSGIKLIVWWLPTTKSQKSPRFSCMQMVCDIPLKNSQRGLKLCFRLHLN
jgi:hypothetical protein